MTREVKSGVAHLHTKGHQGLSQTSDGRRKAWDRFPLRTSRRNPLPTPLLGTSGLQAGRPSTPCLKPRGF